MHIYIYINTNTYTQMYAYTHRDVSIYTQTDKNLPQLKQNLYINILI